LSRGTKAIPSIPNTGIHTSRLNMFISIIIPLKS
jgi:hypothetical protein